MSAHIKLSTLEYPRHVGDMQIDPMGPSDYALVEWVAPPDFDYQTQRCVQSAPVQVGGQWRMTWVVREATAQEIEQANKLLNSRGFA